MFRALRLVPFAGSSAFFSNPGASQVVKFHLKRRDLSMVTDAGDIIVAQGRYTVAVGGGQPGTGVPSVSANFTVNGPIMLPKKRS